MSKVQEPTVLIRWKKDEPTKARVEKHGEKVMFKKGTIRECQYSLALEHNGRGFEIVSYADLSETEQKSLTNWREEERKMKMDEEKEQAKERELYEARVKEEAELKAKAKELMEKLDRHDWDVLENKDVDGLKALVKELELKVEGEPVETVEEKEETVEEPASVEEVDVAEDEVEEKEETPKKKARK